MEPFLRLISIIWGACIGSALAVAAHAQEAGNTEAAASPPQVVVTERECRYFARHRAAADDQI
jgi:hypothetical protein